MNQFRSLRTGTGLMALAAVMLLLALNVGGCSDSDDSPTTIEEAQAPVLPDSQQLEFDFSFFSSADGLEKSHGEYDNFINAYLRTVILDVMARLALAAPVDAFANAVNTVPTALPGGSWRWTYDWQIAGDRVGVVLVGTPAGDVVEWELSLVPSGSTEQYLWFSGTTSDHGEEGHLVFINLDHEDFPVCAEVTWGNSYHGRFLEFISRETDSNGNRLVFYDNDPEFRIEFTLGTDEDSSFIQWNSAGDGSLLVPDYNGGIQACWDINQQDVDCQ